MKLSACLVLSSLLCVISVLQQADTELYFAVPRCQCHQTINEIHQKHIKSFKINIPYEYCKFTEIILTLKDSRDVCLNRQAKMGRNLIRCWKRHSSIDKCRKNVFKRKNSKGQRKPKTDSGGST
ncbi:hypothetical protein XENTR_v10018557 [Xenopus tropicalis]|uniref:Growth-regulated alpha protein n=1 Tax=Xenopus tropicalis TaxID=8364 RepID=A0A8J0QVZ0_XENTR|eukprot:XP_002939600.1 PREDICTED: growth-regulated alpha protein-like [Xenopus tropicalis]